VAGDGEIDDGEIDDGEIDLAVPRRLLFGGAVRRYVDLKWAHDVLLTGEVDDLIFTAVTWRPARVSRIAPTRGGLKRPDAAGDLAVKRARPSARGNDAPSFA
jgi:hypothetical protein